jgi:hypothetical protein
MRLICFISLLTILISCNQKGNKPDISNIHVSVDLKRFDEDFFTLDTNHLQSSIQVIQNKYPHFLSRYFEYFSPINFMVYQQGKTYPEAVREYYRNIKPLYEAAHEKFKNFDPYKSNFEKSLRYVKYYYPAFKIPELLTSVESLNPENAQEIYGTIYFQDTLVVSLQMFLGKNFQAYDPTQYFDYLRRRFEPEYIVPNCIREVSKQIYPDTSQTSILIDQIIEKGKQWFIMDHFLPDTPDSLKTGFTGEQLRWCSENEGNIWAAIVKNADLYTVDPEIIQNYIGEAPFSEAAGMPEQITPGNIGQWVGWQIVKKYAGMHKEMSLQQILYTPSKLIFRDSNYKPK